MSQGSGPNTDGNAEGIVIWIVLFAVMATLTVSCALYLYYWAVGDSGTEGGGAEVVGGIVVGVIGLTGLYIIVRLLQVLYERWVK